MFVAAIDFWNKNTISNKKTVKKLKSKCRFEKYQLIV
jgi:hypothetical protein